MKLSRISTLCNYINRAMPWTAPKTLTTEGVYAVTAYILNLGDLVGDDFVLSDKNMAEVQQKLPDRDGMTRKHGMWSLRGRPDVKNVACMRDCACSSPCSAVGAPPGTSHFAGEYAPVNNRPGACATWPPWPCRVALARNTHWR